jgi:hypothetical protein
MDKTMTGDEALACPYCRGDAAIVERMKGPRVECACGASGPAGGVANAITDEHFREARAFAVREWNRLATLAHQLQAQAAEVARANDQVAFQRDVIESCRAHKAELLARAEAAEADAKRLREAAIAYRGDHMTCRQDCVMPAAERQRALDALLAQDGGA